MDGRRFRHDRLLFGSEIIKGKSVAVRFHNFQIATQLHAGHGYHTGSYAGPVAQ